MRVDFPDVETCQDELKRFCYNQMPKHGWRALRLVNFKGTNLYQWWGKRGETTESRDWCIFEDQATEVFAIYE